MKDIFNNVGGFFNVKHTPLKHTAERKALISKHTITAVCVYPIIIQAADDHLQQLVCCHPIIREQRKYEAFIALDVFHKAKRNTFSQMDNKDAVSSIQAAVTAVDNCEDTLHDLWNEVYSACLLQVQDPDATFLSHLITLQCLLTSADKLFFLAFNAHSRDIKKMEDAVKRFCGNLEVDLKDRIQINKFYDKLFNLISSYMDEVNNGLYSQH